MPRTTAVAGGPGFVVDHGSVVHNSGRQVDWTLVPENMRQTAGQVVTTTAIAAIGATTIAVAALAGPIAAGTRLDFTGPGEFALVTAAAAAGATSLTVEALDAAIESGDTATVAGTGSKSLRAGTVVSESVVGNVRKIYPRSAGGTAIGLIVSDAAEDNKSDALSGYGVYTGGKFYENLLPDSAGGPPRVLPAGMRGELVALPDGVSFETYTDSTT